MIERLSDRRSFVRLRAEGVRRGRGPLRLVTRLASPDDRADSARIAFAIPRTVGNAVKRNRVRRRIRAVLHELSREIPEFPPAGDHLFRVTAPIEHWSHAELRHTMSDLLASEVSS